MYKARLIFARHSMEGIQFPSKNHQLVSGFVTSIESSCQGSKTIYFSAGSVVESLCLRKKKKKKRKGRKIERKGTKKKRQRERERNRETWKVFWFEIHQHRRRITANQKVFPLLFLSRFFQQSATCLSTRTRRKERERERKR